MRPNTDRTIDRAQALIQSQQTPAGYWWYTLEANETIGAEYIFLEHCLGLRSPHLWERLAKRMVSEQRDDGSWGLAHGLKGTAANLSANALREVAGRLEMMARNDKLDEAPLCLVQLRTEADRLLEHFSARPASSREV